MPDPCSHICDANLGSLHGDSIAFCDPVGLGTPTLIPEARWVALEAKTASQGKKARSDEWQRQFRAVAPPCVVRAKSWDLDRALGCLACRRDPTQPAGLVETPAALFRGAPPSSSRTTETPSPQADVSDLLLWSVLALVAVGAVDAMRSIVGAPHVAALGEEPPLRKRRRDLRKARAAARLQGEDVPQNAEAMPPAADTARAEVAAAGSVPPAVPGPTRGKQLMLVIEALARSARAKALSSLEGLRSATLSMRRTTPEDRNAARIWRRLDLHQQLKDRFWYKFELTDERRLAILEDLLSTSRRRGVTYEKDQSGRIARARFEDGEPPVELLREMRSAAALPYRREFRGTMKQVGELMKAGHVHRAAVERGAKQVEELVEGRLTLWYIMHEKARRDALTAADGLLKQPRAFMGPLPAEWLYQGFLESSGTLEMVRVDAAAMLPALEPVGDNVHEMLEWVQRMVEIKKALEGKREYERLDKTCRAQLVKALAGRASYPEVTYQGTPANRASLWNGAAVVPLSAVVDAFDVAPRVEEYQVFLLNVRRQHEKIRIERFAGGSDVPTEEEAKKLQKYLAARLVVALQFVEPSLRETIQKFLREEMGGKASPPLDEWILSQIEILGTERDPFRTSELVQIRPTASVPKTSAASETAKGVIASEEPPVSEKEIDDVVNALAEYDAPPPSRAPAEVLKPAAPPRGPELVVEGMTAEDMHEELRKIDPSFEKQIPFRERQEAIAKGLLEYLEEEPEARKELVQKGDDGRMHLTARARGRWRLIDKRLAAHEMRAVRLPLAAATPKRSFRARTLDGIKSTFRDLFRKGR
jgi:hypothetical protein